MIKIIGSGVAGLWVALLLKQQGHNVEIYEKQSEDLKESCSYRAGGMLAPYCEAENSDPLITRLGVRSIALWQKYFPDFITQKGSLLLSPPRHHDQLRHFKETTSHYELCDTDKIASLEPDLGGRFSTGLFYPTEANLEPRRLLPALIALCRLQGVIFHFETEYTSKPTDKIVIDTRGLSARDTLPTLRGVKGEMILIRCPDVTLLRPVRLLHAKHPIYIVPRPNNIFMIGATTIESDKTSNYVTLRSAGELLTQAYHLHPAFGEAEILEMNTGLRPAFVDNLPKIITQGNVTYMNGLYRHGWTIAPALAEQVVGQY